MPSTQPNPDNKPCPCCKGAAQIRESGRTVFCPTCDGGGKTGGAQ